MDSQLTSYEALDLMFTLSEHFDTIFGYWISASFAVVVGTYVARDQLNLGLAICIGSLYLLASIMFASRWAAMAVLGQEIMFDDAIPESYRESVTFLPLLRIVTFVVGFLVTEGYVIYTYVKVRGEYA